MKKIIAETQQEQTPTAQAPKSPNAQQLLKALKEQNQQSSASPENQKENESTSRYAYSYADQNSKDFLVQLNEHLLDQVRQEAERRNITLSSYIRECLIHRLGKSLPQQEAQIDRLLEYCTAKEGNRTLIVEGEEGFLNQVAKRGLTGDVWTFRQIDKLARKLHTSPRSVEEPCMKAMQLDKVQAQYLRTQTDCLASQADPYDSEDNQLGGYICRDCGLELTNAQVKDKNAPCPECGCMYCKKRE